MIESKSLLATMKQLVDALENHSAIKHPQQIYYRDEAIEAGKQAISELEQRSIAELESQEPKCVVIIEVFGKDWRLEYMSLPVGKHKLYARQYLYTHPPQRTWVGLKDDEIDECDWGQSERDHARAIEAKLKEKNT